MYVADLRIENFKGIRSGYLRFGNHVVLVGANNCGKTTVIEALALLLGRDKLVRSLTEHDFFGSNPQPPDRIRLVATIVDFAGDDPADYSDWFWNDRGVPKWYDSATGNVHSSREHNDWRLACQIAFAARFDRPSLEVVTARCFHDDDSIVDVFDDELVVALPAKLIRDVGFFLVPANRTWDRMMSFGSELFRRVVASGFGPPAESVLRERDRLRQPHDPLELDENLAPIVQELNRELEGFFPSGPKLKLRLTSTDSEGVLDAVAPHYGLDTEVFALPARRHGTGLVSLQSLLLLLEFGRRRAQAGEGFLMALEEPELHVPPALQRKLVYRLQSLSTQTFVTTHSPMVATLADPQAVVLLRNEGGNLSAVRLLDAILPADTPNAVRKLFQVNRLDTVAAIMHGAVLVPEGRLDFDWLRLLLRAIDAQQDWVAGHESNFGVHVGLIPTHDSSVVKTFETMRRLHPRVACLVDGDPAGVDYASDLRGLAIPPHKIIRWPNMWTIEDVVAWIIEPGWAHVQPRLINVVDPLPSVVAELVQRLKTPTGNQNGLKGDQLACEAIADAVSMCTPCCERARALFNALSDVVTGKPTIRFAPGVGNESGVWVFQP